ncbi:MAG: tyrosine-type recombinase/integrase [Candidatus Nealsonbacteria bacterium]|nr:tyrosine-type recombinase/integrase [Candidatus Nealsonbacteria bacterium]
MPNSTRRRAKRKPDKPRPDFPLFAHSNGQWCKKICGALHYFGTWGDPQGALNKYLDEKEALRDGRTPRTKRDGLTVRALVNRFLTTKRAMVDADELTARTFRDYHTNCARIVSVFGKDRLVDDLAADDFERMRTVLAKTMGPEARKVEIQRTKTVFKYAYDAALIDRPVRYGPGFKAPTKRVLMKAKRQNGSRMFEATELRMMLDAALPHIKAMILLGINCGFGNSDISTLPKAALDLDHGWVDHPRQKTGTERRCPLWPETVAALKEAIANRPTPKDSADDGLTFITIQGNQWVRLQGNGWNDAVTIMCRELLAKLGLKRPGRNFYALRHTFRTIADETLDQPAINLIMGHTDTTMAGVYRERISDTRLQAVVDHVRLWLFNSTESK